MGFLTWIAMGLVMGLLARRFMPEEDTATAVVSILVGIGGAVVGGAIASLLGFAALGNFSVVGLVVALGGAGLLLLVYAQMHKEQEDRHHMAPGE